MAIWETIGPLMTDNVDHISGGGSESVIRLWVPTIENQTLVKNKKYFVYILHTLKKTYMHRLYIL